MFGVLVRSFVICGLPEGVGDSEGRGWCVVYARLSNNVVVLISRLVPIDSFHCIHSYLKCSRLLFMTFRLFPDYGSLSFSCPLQVLETMRPN